MSDALTSASKQEAENERNSEIRRKISQKIEKEIRGLIYNAAKFGKVDENRIDELLDEIDANVSQPAGKYGNAWFDRIRIYLLGIKAYCERYKK